MALCGPLPAPRGSTGPPHPINVAEYEAYARAHLQKQVYDYYKSGAHDEITLADNMNAFNRIVLRPRCLVDVSNIDRQSPHRGRPAAQRTRAVSVGVQLLAAAVSRRPLCDWDRADVHLLTAAVALPCAFLCAV